MDYYDYMCELEQQSRDVEPELPAEDEAPVNNSDWEMEF